MQLRVDASLPPNTLTQEGWSKQEVLSDCRVQVYQAGSPEKGRKPEDYGRQPRERADS